jgi:RNA polymerase sigma-54 factor
MADQGPKLGLNLRVAQKQILTPGLVQMVTVLALNKLELREMINQEMVANPVLEEVSKAVPSLDEVQQKIEAERPIAASDDRQTGSDNHDSFQEVDYGSYFNEYLDPGYKSPLSAGEESGALPASNEEPGYQVVGGEGADQNLFRAFNDYLGSGHRSSAAEVIEKPSFENFLTKPASLADHLEWQLSLSICSDAVREAGYSIIGNLNEDGYLTATLEEIAPTGGHRLEEAAEALKLVQDFDPLGVAARDVRECLLIQLRALAASKETPAPVRSACPLAIHIVSDHLKELQNKQFKEISRALDRPLRAVERSVQTIRNLDPRPGQRYNNTQPRLIEPDVRIERYTPPEPEPNGSLHNARREPESGVVSTPDGKTYRARMDEEGLPELRLSHRYLRLLNDKGGTTKDVREYLKKRRDSATQLIKNIQQRKQTILHVCECIIRQQWEFLDKGLDCLRPMMIKDVAHEVGVHPSTVSRAVANKYAYTPQGVYELRFFFSEAVQGPSGGSISLVNLKRIVSKMIEEEDSAKPFTDEQITQRLRERGVVVTRRTVAKYREDLRIPSTHQRRKRD